MLKHFLNLFSTLPSTSPLEMEDSNSVTDGSFSSRAYSSHLGERYCMVKHVLKTTCPGVCTIQEYVLTRSVYHPGVCTIQECVLTRSVYYPGVCTIQECVLSRSVCYPGVCAIQECVPSKSVYYPGVCTIQECVLSRSVYYPGVCTSQECVLSQALTYYNNQVYYTCTYLHIQLL